jgi:hypothetical protein
VQSHGAGIIKVDGTYYMIGEDKSDGPRNVVNCYSSPNLVEWTFAGAPLSMQGGDLASGRVIERPKVIYNKANRKYVMYMHIDSGDYKEAKVGVATSDTVCGKYKYMKSFQPMGKQSRDMGLFQDDDGSAYLLSEDVSALLPLPSFLFSALDIHIPANVSLSAAAKWASHIQTISRLSLSDRRGSHMAGKIRSTSHPQKERCIFHVCQQIKWMGSK